MRGVGMFLLVVVFLLVVSLAAAWLLLRTLEGSSL